MSAAPHAGTDDAPAGAEFRADLRVMPLGEVPLAAAPAQAPDPRRVPPRRERLLDAEQLQELTALDDALAWRAVGATVGLLAVSIGLALAFWPNPVVIATVVVVNAAHQHALFVLAHEAAHYRLLDSRGANDLVGRLIGTLGGVSMCTYRVTHRLHHNHLYGAQDPDIALHGGYPRGRRYLLRKLLIDLCGWTAPKTYAYFFGAPARNSDTGDAQRPLDDTAPALRVAARRDRIGIAIFHLTAPVVLYWFAGLQAVLQYLVLWILPMITILQALLRLRAVAEHGAPSGYDSPLRAARTNLTGTGVRGCLLRLFLFPHHVNYHIEHHLYPAVPHYRLPRLHALLRERGVLARAEVRDFGATLGRLFAPRGSIAEAL